MKKTKLLLIAMLLIATAAMLVGCSSKDDGDKTKIVMWTIATESDSFNKPFNDAIAEYEKAHPDVDIVMETFENEAYKQKIKASVQANELPDIFYTWGGGFSADFVKSDRVLALDSYYGKFQDALPKKVLGNATYDGKLYGVPYVTPVSIAFYNKALFAEAGAEVPETFEDFVDVCQKLIDKGITPIGNSTKDTWVLAMVHDALALKSAGPDKLATALTSGNSYDSEDFVTAATKLTELVDMGAFHKDCAALSNDEACELFYAGETAMYITGSWMAGSLDASNDSIENAADFDCFPVPVVDSADAKITDFMGGAADTLMVAKSTKNADIAADVCFEIAKSVSKNACLSGAGIPAWVVDYEVTGINPVATKAVEYCGKATSFTLWFDTLLAADDSGEYLSMLQDLFAGDITPEEFAAKMGENVAAQPEE